MTASEVLRPAAEGLVIEMGGEPVFIPEEHRDLYHAALASAANHLVTLVAQAADLLRTAGVAEPARLLGPLLSASLDNALRFGDAGLTGPVARGDAATVAAHVAALEAAAGTSAAASGFLSRRRGGYLGRRRGGYLGRRRGGRVGGCGGRLRRDGPADRGSSPRGWAARPATRNACSTCSAAARESRAAARLVAAARPDQGRTRRRAGRAGRQYRVRPGADHGGLAHRPRAAAGRRPHAGRAAGERHRLDLRQPAPVRAERRSRPLPADPGRGPRHVRQGRGAAGLRPPGGRDVSRGQAGGDRRSRAGRPALRGRVPARLLRRRADRGAQAAAADQPGHRGVRPKDAQQLTLVRRMVTDLDLDVVIEPVPTARDADGLATSSRNRYLFPADRVVALALPRALRAGQARAAAGSADPAAVLAAARDALRAEPALVVDYVAVVDPGTFGPAEPGPALLVAAARGAAHG